MPQNIGNIRIICPDCFGAQDNCDLCGGAGLVPFTAIVELRDLADSCIEDLYSSLQKS